MLRSWNLLLTNRYSLFGSTRHFVFLCIVLFFWHLTFIVMFIFKKERINLNDFIFMYHHSSCWSLSLSLSLSRWFRQHLKRFFKLESLFCFTFSLCKFFNKQIFVKRPHSKLSTLEFSYRIRYSWAHINFIWY